LRTLLRNNKEQNVTADEHGLQDHHGKNALRCQKSKNVKSLRRRLWDSALIAVDWLKQKTSFIEDKT